MEMKPTDVCTTRGITFLPPYISINMSVPLGELTVVAAKSLPDGHLGVELGDVADGLDHCFRRRCGRVEGFEVAQLDIKEMNAIQLWVR
jgi:hypothetical protein